MYSRLRFAVSPESSTLKAATTGSERSGGLVCAIAKWPKRRSATRRLAIFFMRFLCIVTEQGKPIVSNNALTPVTSKISSTFCHPWIPLSGLYAVDRKLSSFWGPRQRFQWLFPNKWRLSRESEHVGPYAVTPHYPVIRRAVVYDEDSSRRPISGHHRHAFGM